jgi:ubiquinone/menaquinone biosynthesis C-methylase UbiE
MSGPAGLPAGPFGRALWLSSDPVPAGFARQVLSRPDGAPLDAAVVDDLTGTARECEVWQARLRPGGFLVVRHASRPRRLARRLRPYFEGGAARDGERFRPVQAQGSLVVAQRRGPGAALGHFDELAEDYVAELPAHLAQHYLGRKLAVLRAAVGDARAGLGLDLGCGVGAYARGAADALSARVVAVDASAPVVAVARAAGAAGVDFLASDAQRLPFADGTFDFAYTINMVHHLKRGEQGPALAEALRVLKPGAPLVVFEINVTNPLFRLYMRKVFPRTRRIDRGDEEFLTPRGLRRVAPVDVESVAYSTFIPDFAPRWSLRALRPVERLLERAAGPMGIHYAAVLRRR